jgi:hypothetical protein
MFFTCISWIKAGKRLSAMAVDSSVGPGMQVPIVLENNVIFLNGTIGGSKLRFCLDTGAELNVLSNGVSKKGAATIPAQKHEYSFRLKQQESKCSGW